MSVNMCLKNHKIFQTIDNELYYYGFNSLDKYDYIAQGLRPIGRINAHLYGVDYPFCGFFLIDDMQFFLYKGMKSGTIMVDSICAYGFNDHILVTEVISDQGIRYYHMTDFKDFHNSIEIKIDTSCITNPIMYFNLDRWIYDVNNPPQNLCAMSDFCIKNFFMIVLNEFLLITLFIMFVFNIKKLLKKRATKEYNDSVKLVSNNKPKFNK